MSIHTCDKYSSLEHSKQVYFSDDLPVVLWLFLPTNKHM